MSYGYSTSCLGVIIPDDWNRVYSGKTKPGDCFLKNRKLTEIPKAYIGELVGAFGCVIRKNEKDLTK